MQQFADRLPGQIDAGVYPVTLLEVGKGLRVRMHSNQRPTLCCVLEGTLSLAAGDHPPLAAETGCAVLIPARVEAMIGASPVGPRTAPVSSRWLPQCGDLPVAGTPRNRPGALRVLMAQLTPAAGDSDAVEEPLAIDLKAIGNLHLAFLAMRAEIDQPRLGVRLLAGALMKTCLVHLFRRHFPQACEPAHQSRTAAAVEALRTKPGAAHSVESLAQIVGMSRATFARHFLRETGMRPMEFVAKARGEQAATLLRTSALPIKTIAAECGFADRSHFSRAFRRIHGVDPSCYRREASDAEPKVEGGQVKIVIPA